MTKHFTSPALPPGCNSGFSVILKNKIELERICFQVAQKPDSCCGKFIFIFLF